MPRRFGSQTRSYAGSHPWISFTFDLQRLVAMDFVRLGEALSKCDHIAGVPLPPDVAQQLHMVYLVKGIHATTQIEGNSLSEDEVRARVEGDLPLPESQEYLGKEVDNILAACNLVAEELASGQDMRLTRQRIEQFNKMVLAGLPAREGVVAGKIRTKGVGVGNVYLGAPAADCEFLLDELCRWLEQLVEDAGPEWQRAIGLIRAILAHLYLAWIHPFGDGNGRTARLVEFQLLLEAGFPSPACHLLSNYYNRTRHRYYIALQETSQGPSYPTWRFVSYALQGFVEELREQLGVIQSTQLGTVWVNFVHAAHLGQSAPTTRRRRDLALALPGDMAQLTPISALTRLTPDLAAHYAGKTPKTLTRDINALEEAGLIVREGSAIRPFLERLFAFLPLRKPEVGSQPEPGSDQELLDSLAAASVQNTPLDVTEQPPSGASESS
jgi:Fic family protein